jgi:hypothetical protein
MSGTYIRKFGEKDLRAGLSSFSIVFPFATCAAFVILTSWLGDRSFASVLRLAFIVWIIGPLPLILTNAAFIKLHRVFVVLYSTGWLVKLVIAAHAAHWLLA